MLGSTATSPTQKALPYLTLVIAVFVAYSNVYDNALVFDDNLLITLNEYLRSWNMFGRILTSSTIDGAHVAGGFYRPLQGVLYFFIYQLGGLEPFGYHLLNVAIHAANACLVWMLGRRLGFHPRAAFFGALIWALHPLHTEAVTYASGTAEPLVTFFCLLGLIALLPDFAWRRVALSVPLFILALLSEEIAVVFPALVMSCIFLRSEKRLHPKTYLPTLPLWLIAIGYAAWRATAPGFDGPQNYDQLYTQHDFSNLTLYAHHFPYRVNTFLATLPAYLQLLVRPVGLHMERSFPVFVSLWTAQALTGLAMIAASVALIVWSLTKTGKRRGLALGWGLLWFAAAYFPDTGLIYAMNSQFLEHWMYLPTIGLFLGAAETIVTALGKIPNRSPWRNAKPAAALAALAVAMVFALATFEQNEVWRSPFTFYANIFKYGEVSPRAHNNLALAYGDEDDYPAAIAEFKKAIALTDTYAETRYNLALTLLQLPDADARLTEVIADLNRSLEIDPHFYRSWEALANIYDHLDETKKAADARKQAEKYYNGK